MGGRSHALDVRKAAPHDKQLQLTRRGFLRLTGLGTAAARLGALGFHWPPFPTLASGGTGHDREATARRFDIADFNRITVPGSGTSLPSRPTVACWPGRRYASATGTSPRGSG